MTDETPQQPLPGEGEGNQPEGTGYAPPDTGAGDSAESEIPVGVDAIEAKDPPADDAEGGGSAAVDVADLNTDNTDPEGGGEKNVSAEAEGGINPEAEGSEKA